MIRKFAIVALLVVAAFTVSSVSDLDSAAEVPLSATEPPPPITTPTTLDLSFLNTTTTSPPVTVQIATQIAPDPESRWDQLAQCESGGNWSTNTGNGFGGGLQFMHQRSYSTWLSFGGAEFSPNPWEASREQQIVIAERVLASSGWNAWPGCTRRFNWR